MNEARSQLVIPLASSSIYNYEQAYDIVLRTSMLQDLSDFWEIWKVRNNNLTAEILKPLFESWNVRLSIATPSFRVCEPLLNLRRLLLNELRQ